MLVASVTPLLATDTTRGLGAAIGGEVEGILRGETGRAVEFCVEKGEPGRFVELYGFVPVW